MISGCQSKLNAESSTTVQNQSIKVIENFDVTESSESSEFLKDEKNIEKVQRSDYYNTYNINITVNPKNRKFEGLETLTYKNTTGKNIKYIYFHTYAKALERNSEEIPYTQEYEKEIFKYGQDYSRFNVKTVCINKKEINFEQNNTILILELDGELEENETTEITIQFDGYLPQIAYRMGANKEAMWFGNFFPIVCRYGVNGWCTEPYYSVGEPFYSDISNYNVTVVTPKGYTVIGTGDESFTEEENERTTVLNAKLVRDFSFCISDKYNLFTYTTKENVNVNFWCYSDITKVKSKLISIAEKTIEYYGGRLGSYPYGELDMAEVDLFSEIPQSYPGFIMIDSDNINNSYTIDKLAEGIGKQWLGSIIGIDCINDIWLRDGLNGYFYRKLLYTDEAIESEYNDITDGNRIFINDSIRHYKTWEEYYSVQSDKSWCMFYELNEIMGDKKFEDFMKLFYKEYAFRTVTVREFIDISQKIYGEDLTEFFKLWLETQEVLPLE